MSLDQLRREIIYGIYDNRMLMTAERDKPEGWRLVSGMWSPFYIQLRLISSYPAVLDRVGEAMSILLKEKLPHVNRLVGIAFAGIPIATAASLKSAIPACHTRKIVGTNTDDEMRQILSQYGQHSLVEGVIQDGDVLCLVDDLVTGLDSKILARKQVLEEVKHRGLKDVHCEDVIVVVDRQQGAESKAHELGLYLHSIVKFVDEALPLLKDRMSASEYDEIHKYLRGS